MDVQLPCLSDGKNGRTEDWHTIYHHLRRYELVANRGDPLLFQPTSGNSGHPPVPSKSSKISTEAGKLLPSSKTKGTVDGPAKSDQPPISDGSKTR